MSHQTKNIKNAGFTLVEVMVVILIISILVALGNYWDFTQRREKARLEELAVQLTAMMDQEKTNTLLGKTEWGAIVRQRKIELSFTGDILTYKSFADLVEDTEWNYCWTPGNGTACPTPPWWTSIPIITKSWQFYDPSLVMTIYDCDSANPPTISRGASLITVLKNDTMSFSDGLVTFKHIVIFLSRNGAYREIHIDRRTGVIYEREGANTGVVSCI